MKHKRQLEKPPVQMGAEWLSLASGLAGGWKGSLQEPHLGSPGWTSVRKPPPNFLLRGLLCRQPWRTMPNKIWPCYCPHSKFTLKLGQTKAEIWAGGKIFKQEQPLACVNCREWRAKAGEGAPAQAGPNSLHSPHVPEEPCRGTGLPQGLTTALGAVGASGEYLNLRKAQEFELNHVRESLQSLVF